MSQLTVSFTLEWLDAQRKIGKRVIRQLERRIVSLEWVSLKHSSSHNVEVELETKEREKFLKSLIEWLKTELGEDDPWACMTVTGDTSGLDIPDKTVKKSQQNDTAVTEELPKTPQEDKQKVKKNVDSDSQPKENLQDVLEDICGKVPIKHSRELEAYVRETAEVIPMLQKMGAESSLWHQHLLMAVDPGYGRSEFLSAIARLYKAAGIVKGELDQKSVREFILLPSGCENKEDGYRVSWDSVLRTAEGMENSNIRNGISKVILYIDISAWQHLLTTSDVKVKLRHLNALCGTFLIVFRVPSLEGHILRETADALNDIFNVRTISVPPAPIDALLDYAREELSKSGFQLDDNSLAAFEQLLLREKIDDSFFGYKTMDKIVQKIIYDKALSNCRNKQEDRTISQEDLGRTSNANFEDNPALELKNLIGIEKVVQRLNEAIFQIQTQRKMAAKGKSVGRPAIHMLFTGNPGTGKTTVARILARMMQRAGILRKGHIVEVKGRDLCGQYVGETAPKTTAICRDAYGSVLFIDEAYTLFRSEYSKYDYGREALDTLVAEMDNHRDDLCVIMAGYKDEMEAMLQGNAGLKGRIPYEIEFPNYTRDELEKIFFTMLDGVFDYEEGLKSAVHDLFASIPEETFQSKEFSNARLVRNLYERTWGKAVYRQSLEGGKLQILQRDLAGAMSDSEFKKLLKKNVERPKIGFGS